MKKNLFPYVLIIMAFLSLAFSYPSDGPTPVVVTKVSATIDTLWVSFSAHQPSYGSPTQLLDIASADSFMAASPDSVYDIYYFPFSDVGMKVYRDLLNGSRYSDSLQVALLKNIGGFRSDSLQNRYGRGYKGAASIHPTFRGVMIVRIPKTVHTSSHTSHTDTIKFVPDPEPKWELSAISFIDSSVVIAEGTTWSAFLPLISEWKCETGSDSLATVTNLRDSLSFSTSDQFAVGIGHSGQIYAHKDSAVVTATVQHGDSTYTATVLVRVKPESKPEKQEIASSLDPKWFLGVGATFDETYRNDVNDRIVDHIAVTGEMELGPINFVTWIQTRMVTGAIGVKVPYVGVSVNYGTRFRFDPINMNPVMIAGRRFSLGKGLHLSAYIGIEELTVEEHPGYFHLNLSEGQQRRSVDWDYNIQFPWDETKRNIFGLVNLSKSFGKNK